MQLDIQQMLNVHSRLVIKPEIIQSLSACKSYSINLLDSLNYLLDTPYFLVSWSKRFCLFLSIPTQWLSNQHLSFLNLYQHTKNQLISSFILGYIYIYIYIYINFVIHFFFNILRRNSKLLIFGNLGILSHAHLKW